MCTQNPAIAFQRATGPPTNFRRMALSSVSVMATCQGWTVTEEAAALRALGVEHGQFDLACKLPVEATTAAGV